MTLAPDDVSALVVGIDRYDFSSADATLPGMARSALRFADWLVRNEVCRPERITLMTAVDPDDHVNDLLLQAPRRGYGTQFTGLADKDFTRWLRECGPQQGDSRFVLFWAGHGFTDPDDTWGTKLHLLGADASDESLRNVEFHDLIEAVGKVAPHASVTAFVDACRKPVPLGEEEPLRHGVRRITPPHEARGQEPDRDRAMTIMYAAAHGDTTAMASDASETFAGALLEMLDALEPGKGPDAIFGDGLDDLIGRLKERGNYATYGYWHRDAQHHDEPFRFTTGIDPRYLTPQEWTRLTAIAAGLDAADDDDLTERLRQAAYSHAVEVVEYPLRRFGSLQTLFKALRARPARYMTVPPPLVIACDYLAELPEAGSRPSLRQWCDDWAKSRQGDGKTMLDRAGKLRPRLFSDRPYLVIWVEESPSTRRKRSGPSYRMTPGLVTATGWDDLRDKDDPREKDATAAPGDHIVPTVPVEQIMPAMAQLVDRAMDRGSVERLDDLTVELILPKKLRGRWLEYGEAGSERYGARYAIAIRADEFARERHARGTARSFIRDKKKHIDELKPDDEVKWWTRIDWFTCRDRPGPDDSMADRLAERKESFCIALGNTAAGGGLGSPLGYERLIEQGAAVIIAMKNAAGCSGCSQREPGQIGPECAIVDGKNRIMKEIGAKNWGPLDLPLIMREVRRQLEGEERSSLRCGVYMESLERTWDNRYKSPYSI